MSIVHLPFRSEQQDALDLAISSLFNVRGKVALVSGGASGIGQMIASGLVVNGAKVYIVSRKEKQLKEVLYIMRPHSLRRPAPLLGLGEPRKAGSWHLLLHRWRSERKHYVCQVRLSLHSASLIVTVRVRECDQTV